MCETYLTTHFSVLVGWNLHWEGAGKIVRVLQLQGMCSSPSFQTREDFSWGLPQHRCCQWGDWGRRSGRQRQLDLWPLGNFPYSKTDNSPIEMIPLISKQSSRDHLRVHCLHNILQLFHVVAFKKWDIETNRDCSQEVSMRFLEKFVFLMHLKPGTSIASWLPCNPVCWL